jgi:hypothetical protein
MLRNPGEKNFSPVGLLGTGYGITIPGEKFTKLGLYKLQAIASWEGGHVRSRGSTTFEVVPDKLEIKLTAKPARVIEGDEVSFSVQVSGDPQLAKIVWEFGDGTTKTDANVPPAKDLKHVFSDQGRKEVRATVTAADGGTAQSTADVLVDSDEIEAFIVVFVEGRKSFDQSSERQADSVFGRIIAGQEVVLKPSRDRTADGVEYLWQSDGLSQSGASFIVNTSSPKNVAVSLRATRHSSEASSNLKIIVRPRAPWWVLVVAAIAGILLLAYFTYLLTGNKMADWKLSVWSPSQKTAPTPKPLNAYWSRVHKVAVVPLAEFKRDPLLSSLKDSTHKLRCAKVPAGRNRLPGNVVYDGKRRDDRWTPVDKEFTAKRSQWELTLSGAACLKKDDGIRSIRLEYAEQNRLVEKMLLASLWVAVIAANVAVYSWVIGH